MQADRPQTANISRPLSYAELLQCGYYETPLNALTLELLNQKSNNHIGLILTDQEDWQCCSQDFYNNFHPFVMIITFLQRLFNQRCYKSNDCACKERWWQYCSLTQFLTPVFHSPSINPLIPRSPKMAANKTNETFLMVKLTYVPLPWQYKWI